MCNIAQYFVTGAVIAATSITAASAAPQVTVVNIQAEIDGRSRLEFMGGDVRWQHFDFAAPGRLECDLGEPAEATLIGGVAWWPAWPDTPTCENRDCGGCTSDVWNGTPAPLPLVPSTAHIVVQSARGAVTILEQPSAANGFRVVLEFDDNYLGGAAWYDVDLEVRVDPPGVTRYCVSLPNTSGTPALIDLAGSRSVGGNDTRLLASGCPAQHAAIFLCGTAPAWIPFGDGILCISPFNPGLMRLGPVEMIRVDGTLDHPLDMQALGPIGGIHPGSTLYFQAWFRDVRPGGYGANLTDAIEVEFVE